MIEGIHSFKQSPYVSSNYRRLSSLWHTSITATTRCNGHSMHPRQLMFCSSLIPTRYDYGLCLYAQPFHELFRVDATQMRYLYSVFRWPAETNFFSCVIDARARGVCNEAPLWKARSHLTSLRLNFAGPMSGYPYRQPSLSMASNSLVERAFIPSRHVCFPLSLPVIIKETTAYDKVAMARSSLASRSEPYPAMGSCYNNPTRLHPWKDKNSTYDTAIIVLCNDMKYPKNLVKKGQIWCSNE